MDLWDRLCCILRARTVSVEDVSSKVVPLAAFLCSRMSCELIFAIVTPVSVDDQISAGCKSGSSKWCCRSATVMLSKGVNAGCMHGKNQPDRSFNPI